MDQSYAETRIREALKLSHSNPVKTRKMLEKWCAEDSRLLQAISKPHMTGILAHAIERVSNKVARGEAPSVAKAVITRENPQSKDDIDFGKELLKNLGMGKPPKFAQESHSVPIGKKKASQSHIDAINFIAGKKTI